MSNKPIEYTNAILAVDTAWKKYDEAIERGESYEVINEYGKTAQYLEKHKSNIYAMWQDLGGTGDIKTLVNADLTAVEEATEVEAEYQRWDYTPIPRDMPIIDFDTIKEIPY